MKHINILKKLILAIIHLSLALFTLNAQTWTQVGSDIDGEDVYGYSGWSVGLSSDGTIVAIGEPWNNGNGAYAGLIRVFEIQGGNWVQIGDNIYGEAAGDNLGSSVSLNSDGTIVAIGAPSNDENGTDAGNVKVYENQGGNWIQIGNDINGEAAYDHAGQSVSLSSDGTIVAIGAPQNLGSGFFKGHVRIYENQDGYWVQIGSDIDGEADMDSSGSSVSLNSNGTVIAIGAPGNNENGNGSGHVRVFENQGGNWVQIGNDIDGEAAYDSSGSSVSLNSDGTIVAIGAPSNGENGIDAGHARVYENQSGNWLQIGNDIDGEAANNASGYSVCLNPDGTVLAIGAPTNDGNGSQTGHVRIYNSQSGNWIQIGNDIDGETNGDMSGWSVSLSSDGTIVAIGAPYNYGNGTDAGHVRVYSCTVSINNIEDIYMAIYSHAGNIVIEFNEHVTGEVKVFNSLGQQVAAKVLDKTAQTMITMSTPGYYLIRVVCGLKIVTRKLNVR